MPLVHAQMFSVLKHPYNTSLHPLGFQLPRVDLVCCSTSVLFDSAPSITQPLTQLLRNSYNRVGPINTGRSLTVRPLLWVRLLEL